MGVPHSRWRSWFVAGAAGRRAQFANWVLAVGLLGALLVLSFRQLPYEWRWGAVFAYRAKLWQGLGVTVGMAGICLVTSTAVGLLAALAQRGPLLLLRYVARLYVEGIRGTPFLVQILVMFYVVAAAAGLENRYLVGVLALTAFSGAYISEIFRAGLESIGQTQLDSARALGFTSWQTHRFVILPQALRQVLPPLAGQFASLIKDSSLLSVIAVSELALNAQEINSNTLATFETFLLLALGYLVLTLPISLLARWLEGRSHYET